MEQIINTICKALTIITSLINIETNDSPVLPMTRYDICVSTGVAKSPTTDRTTKRRNSQAHFLTVKSV